ncbi:Endonuclease YhcR precursor [Candidatus Izimaplasma bacterium HR1]|jgi:2',3'-cyclic-nucleotide 2'-phosphodiesterase (5'-nucleotidase family)|uniref:bifunctional metallophosphatase/5'-nucleotidase n=1 Tax=Candidatus Izimoplasma sp. HR1 TaxID=1541959 RepID=UPI0004F72D59|nr:Endonuclease YhcR precursor [Candidatus Izimaplasma bacterium HR1]
MKKLFTILLLLLISFTLSSCDKEPEITVEDYLEVYYLNDFHGALTPSSDQLGISYIANLVNTAQTETPENSIFIVGGDMLQGSALSNYYDGLSTINLLNLMGLDAFTLGNHEFDWGLDVIATYKDGNLENGEADFPFLGANIYYEGTTTSPDWIDPYVILERGEHKIGVIGTMGYGLEYAIAQSKIDGYEFGDPVEAIEHYSEYLRTTEGCDIIIVSSHDSGSYLNNELLRLPDAARVDAIFNGHSHSSYQRIDNDVAIVQSGSNGEFVGYVKWDFRFDPVDIEVDNIDAYGSALLDVADPDVEALLNQYIAETDEFLGDVIITSNDNYSKGELSWWLTDLMREVTQSDIAFHNYGGTRSDISLGEEISLSTLYDIWPFDNIIKTVLLRGDTIKVLINSGDLAYSSDISLFEDDVLYRVATNDYVFDKTTNPFINGEDIVNTGIVIRNLVNDELLLQSEEYSDFSTRNSFMIDHNDYVIEE